MPTFADGVDSFAYQGTLFVFLHPGSSRPQAVHHLILAWSILLVMIMVLGIVIIIFLKRKDVRRRDRKGKGTLCSFLTKAKSDVTMHFPVKQIFQKNTFEICCPALVFLLTGCSWGESSNISPTPTPSPSATPTSPPTPITKNLATYKGNGYTIEYPKGWQVSSGEDGFVSFSDPREERICQLQASQIPTVLLLPLSASPDL